MMKLFFAISLVAMVPHMSHSDIFGYNEYGEGNSGSVKSEWLLLDDDRDVTSDPYPWGMTATCDGNGGYEFTFALHGILTQPPGTVSVTYTIGDGEPVMTHGFALDSIITGLPDSLGTAMTKAVSTGQRIDLGVTGESGIWSTDFEGYIPDPDKVSYVSGGCQ